MECMGLSEEEDASPAAPQLSHLVSPTDLVKYENQTLIHLISIFKNNKCLWDKNHGDYVHRPVREEAWASVYDYYKRTVLNPDQRRMKSMFSNLRTCWRREHKLVKASADTDNVHKPKLWYYNLLSFLAGEGDDKEDIDVDHDEYLGRDFSRRSQDPLQEPGERLREDLPRLQPRRSLQTSGQRQVKAFTTAGSGTTPVCKPEIFYYDHHGLVAEGEDGEGGDLDLSESDWLANDTQDLRPKRPKTQKTDLAIKTKTAVLEAAHKLISTFDGTRDEDMWVTQGKLWGQRLSAMETDQRTIATKLIADVIYFADLKMLAHGASVSPSRSAAPTTNAPNSE